MNSLKYFMALLMAFGILATTNSCTEDFEELNTQPDALIASQLDVNLLGQAFAQSQYFSMMGESWRFQIAENLFSDLFAQYFATTAANFDSDRHVEVGRWIDLAWSSFYGQAAPQIKLVEDQTSELGLSVENAVVKVWRVQAYHRITDYWGPIIYSQFGNGETSVAYDTQEFVYNDFFTTLDEVVSVLQSNSGASVFPAHDQLFGGDVDKWLTFANSLRLRLAMRIRYADPAKAQAEAEKAVAAGVMMDNSDTAELLTTDNSRNPFFTITNWGEFRMSADMESILEGYNDPRIGEFFSVAADGDDDSDGSPYEGLRNGLAKVDKTATLNTQYSDMAPEFLDASRGGTNPAIKVMNAAEVYFLRAEGALLGWNMGGSAEELYEEGIRQSMDQWGFSGGAVDSYINSSATPTSPDDVFGSGVASTVPIAFDAGGGMERQLEQIITQKWISLYPDGWEAWSELRRTGYPSLYPRLNSDNPDVPADAIMRRVTFVEGEFSNNLAAVEAAQSLSELAGGDKNDTKVWWDKK